MEKSRITAASFNKQKRYKLIKGDKAVKKLQIEVPQTYKYCQEQERKKRGDEDDKQTMDGWMKEVFSL